MAIPCNLNSVQTTSRVEAWKQVFHVLKNYSANYSLLADAQECYSGCTSLSGRVPEMKMSAIENAEKLFYHCSSLVGEVPDLGYWSSTPGSIYVETFAGCKGLSGSVPL